MRATVGPTAVAIFVLGCGARAVTPIFPQDVPTDALPADDHPTFDSVEASPDAIDAAPDADHYPQETIVRACVLAQSCGAPFDPIDLPGVYSTDCVAWFQIATSTPGVLDAYTQFAFNCAVGASGCSDYLACIGVSSVPASTCVGVTSTCIGSRIVRCDLRSARPTFTLDCATAMPLQTCDDSGGVARCVDGRMCSASDYPTCAGRIALTCDHSIESEATCDWMFPGTSCMSGACVGPGAACDPAAPVGCSGTTASVCDTRTGHVLTIDCDAVFDGHCGANPPNGPLAGCSSNATECSFGDRQCRGSQLDVCVNGRFHTLDCTALGLVRCNANALGDLICAP